MQKHLLLLRLIGALALCACAHSARADPVPSDNDELPAAARVLVDETHEIPDEKLGSIIKDYGEHIGELMRKELDALIADEAKRAQAPKTKAQIDKEELERFKRANSELSRDAQASIAQAGSPNQGQTTQSFASAAAKSKAFVSHVNERLAQAGTAIGARLSSLSSLAPKIKGKMRAIPAALRKLMRWPSFLNFKVRFNKVYKSLREELYRQMIYLRTQTLVGIQNMKFLFGRTTHLQKATEFADWTENEYHEAFDNELAERVGDADAAPALSDAMRAKMTQLAAQGKTVFGAQLPADALTSRATRRRRRRREIDELAADDEEEGSDDEDEGFEEVDNELGDETASAVDEYAAEFDENADASKIAELDALLDEAAEEPAQAPFLPVDLRKTRCIIKPENQHRCGCCYAHVTTAAASYYNCMDSQRGDDESTRVSTRFSTRFISDCGRYLTPEGERPGINGCAGGRLSRAIEFAKRAGMHEFLDYELARASVNFKSDQCAWPRPGAIDAWGPQAVDFYRRARFANLKLDDVAVHLRAVGPVFVNMRTWKTFPTQGSGVYGGFDESDDPTVHSMLIVGHDRDAHQRDYYIVWNSHGIAWGEDGFVRIYKESLDYFKVYLGGFVVADSE